MGVPDGPEQGAHTLRGRRRDTGQPVPLVTDTLVAPSHPPPCSGPRFLPLRSVPHGRPCSLLAGGDTGDGPGCREPGTTRNRPEAALSCQLLDVETRTSTQPAEQLGAEASASVQTNSMPPPAPQGAHSRASCCTNVKTGGEEGEGKGGRGRGGEEGKGGRRRGGEGSRGRGGREGGTRKESGGGNQQLRQSPIPDVCSAITPVSSYSGVIGVRSGPRTTAHWAV